MTISDVYSQTFVVYKIKLRRLIIDLINDLGYLYMHYYSYIFVTRRKY